MPRPRKCRQICRPPSCTRFGPAEAGNAQAVVMTMDEYETLRLIDWEGLNQEQCARQMQVARTTAQAIYAAARKKLAGCLVQGAPLHIQGGDVQVCRHRGHSCGAGCCRRCAGEEAADKESPKDANPNGEEATQHEPNRPNQ